MLERLVCSRRLLSSTMVLNVIAVVNPDWNFFASTILTVEEMSIARNLKDTVLRSMTGLSRMIFPWVSEFFAITAICPLLFMAIALTNLKPDFYFYPI